VVVIWPFELVAGGQTRCDSSWRLAEPVFSDAHRLYFVSHGSASIRTGRQTTALRGGRAYFIPGLCLLQYRCERQMTLHWLHVRARDAATDLSLGQVSRPVSWPLSKLRFWSPVWRKIAPAIEAPAQAPQAYAQVQAMVIYLVAQVLGERGEAAAPQATRLGRLAPALRWMDEHFRRNPSLAELAALVHRCPAHFHREFRRALGVSPFAYMLRLRMRLARDLLESGDANVTEAARQCGYPNVFYFSRVFRQYYHVAPSQVRRHPGVLHP
jgi:AraC-like DNA-binding protein